MENNNDIIELLDILYGMVNEAWSVPLGNDKCIIEREKAIEIINDIKANLPTSIAESKRLVTARDEFIGNAKREAEAMRKNAEEQSERLVNEQEVLKIAQKRADEILSTAEKKSQELKRVASEYVDKIMRDAERQLADSLETVRSTQAKFRSSEEYEATPEKPVANVESKPVANPSAEIKPAAVAEKKPVVPDLPEDEVHPPRMKKPQMQPRPMRRRDINDEDNWVEK